MSRNVVNSFQIQRAVVLRLAGDNALQYVGEISLRIEAI
jgi:hypothetical protein